MRVLVVTNAYPHDGDANAGLLVKEQVDSLRRVGVDTEVLHLDRRSGGRRVYRSLPDRLRAALSADRPDLVHVMYGGVMAYQVARSLGNEPLVVSYCGNDLLGEGNAPMHRRWMGRYSVRCSHRAAARADAIVVKSRGLYTALPAGIDRARVSIVPNGVDLERFAPRDARAAREQLGWSHDRRHVLFPSDPTRTEKRFGLAAGAVDLVRADGIDVELHALDGVARADVPLWMNASDVVLLTSTHEGSPNVIKEALACDVPVVSVDVGDVRERIEGVDGCHLAEATPEDLAAKLRSALAAGRVDARPTVAHLSHERVAEQLREIYAAVVG